MRGAKNGWTLLLLVLAGVVLGGFIGSLAANVSGLSWLNYGQAFGLENPLVLSLGLVVLTFGLTIKITIGQHHWNSSGNSDLPLDIRTY